MAYYKIKVKANVYLPPEIRAEDRDALLWAGFQDMISGTDEPPSSGFKVQQWKTDPSRQRKR